MTSPGGVRLQRHTPAAALLLLLAAGYGVFTWSEQLGDFGGDSAAYVLTAQSYAPYLPTAPAASEIARDTIYPPLYPLWLMAFGGADDLQLAHAATTAAMLAAFAAFYGWLLAIGVSAPLAAAGMAVFALLPGTVLQSLLLHSESLYLACSLAGLAALSRGVAGRTRWYWIAAALIAAALLTRTAGVALLPALAVTLWRARPPQAWAMAAVAVLPALAWRLWHQEGGSYALLLLRRYAGTDAGSFLQRVSGNASAFFDGLVGNWVQVPSLQVVPALLLTLSAVVGLVRLWRLEPDAWYVLAYAAMVALWPYRESSRFAWVLSPVLLGYLLCLAERSWPSAHAGAKPWRQRVPTGFLLTVFALTLLPGLALTVQRFRHPLAQESPALRHYPEWYVPDVADAILYTQRHRQLIDAMRAVGDAIPADDCVLSIKPSLTALYAGRRSRPPPDINADAAAFEDQLERSGCTLAMLLPYRSGTYPRHYYPLDRLDARLVPIDEAVAWREDGRDVKLFLARIAPAPGP